MQDADDFIQKITTDSATLAYLRHNAATDSVTVARAPGRLDVMGGVGDYSGALVAELTIAEASLTALCKRGDRVLRVWSVNADPDLFTPIVEIPLETFYDGGELVDYPTVSRRLREDQRSAWAAYLLGCFYVLLAEKIAPDFAQGANILLESVVPFGAGVSSSAAIEVSTMQAISGAYGLNLDGVALARLCQMVENRVVGAPCGIMDQLTSALGVEQSLLLLLCRPHTVMGTQALPPGARFFGINSDVKHSVGGGPYGRARIAAHMARRMIGVEYLTEVTIPQYRDEYQARMPSRISGEAFLAQWGETGDPVTRIDPSVKYSVAACARHAIYEHDRVHRFVNLLGQPDPKGRKLRKAGTHMYASHWSYSRIGLGCRETDLLVMLARAAGTSRGIYGAKITGGGSGGSVAILTYGENGEQAVQEIAAKYRAETGNNPQVMSGGDSPGAIAFGTREIAIKGA